jgi:hypothetical protein
MKITKRRRLTAKKLVLPLVAIGMMTTAMSIDAAHRPQSSASAPAATARAAYGLQQR